MYFFSTVSFSLQLASVLYRLCFYMPDIRIYVFVKYRKCRDATGFLVEWKYDIDRNSQIIV